MLMVEVIFFGHVNELGKHMSILIIKEFFASMPMVSAPIIGKITSRDCVLVIDVF